MDTRINSSYSVSSFVISPQELGRRLGHTDAPLLLDVRPQPRFDASPRMLAGARRCSAENVPVLATALFATNLRQILVTYCVYGHQVSADAAAVLRAAGLCAHLLAGEFEGGEDGIDSAQAIAQWRMAAPLTMVMRVDWGIPQLQPSRWVTRARPKIDRIACPWLICRLIDSRSEFFYVPTEQVLNEAKRMNAAAYDIPDAPVSHEGERCSFDTLLAAFDLKDAALDRLARIVRGADTDRLNFAAESAGLLALSVGLSSLHADDHAMLDAALPMYDALYARFQSAVVAAQQGRPAETHNWTPKTTIETTR